MTADTQRLLSALADARRQQKNLAGHCYNNTDLRGAPLYRADLEWVELRGADLSGAQLDEADLRHADLTGANLRDAHLDDARLEGCILDQAVLDGASIQRVLVDRYTVERSHWSPEAVCALRARGALFVDLDRFPANVQESLAVEALKSFIKTAFQPTELERWLLSRPETRQLVSDVFWQQSWSSVASDTVELLFRHKRIDMPFFEDLLKVRSGRVQDLVALARQWRLDLRVRRP